MKPSIMKCIIYDGHSICEEVPRNGGTYSAVIAVPYYDDYVESGLNG